MELLWRVFLKRWICKVANHQSFNSATACFSPSKHCFTAVIFLMNFLYQATFSNLLGYWVLGLHTRKLSCILTNLWVSTSVCQCSMILNGNIFQTAPSSEFRTGSSLEKYVLCQLTNSELDLVWNSELGSVWNLYFFI